MSAGLPRPGGGPPFKPPGGGPLGAPAGWVELLGVVVVEAAVAAEATPAAPKLIPASTAPPKSVLDAIEALRPLKVRRAIEILWAMGCSSRFALRAPPGCRSNLSHEPVSRL